MDNSQRKQRTEKVFDIYATKLDFNYKHFRSLNVSESGLLIYSQGNFDLGIGESVYLVIDPREEFIEKPIACRAVIARFAKTDQNGVEKYHNLVDGPSKEGPIRGFGVYIDYMEPSQRKAWNKFLEQTQEVGQSS